MRCYNYLKVLGKFKFIIMENLEQYSGLKELELNEMKLISGGDSILYRLGRGAHKAYCYLVEWATEYEGDPYIKQKMGGL